MKKMFVLLFMLIAIYGYSQKVSDATIKTYGDTYLNTNATGSITGAMLNTYLNYMISSKVNHDSATTVRVSTPKDTLFITYWGFPEDTVLLGAASSPWTLNGTDVYPDNVSYDVAIGSGNPAGYKFHVTGESYFSSTLNAVGDIEADADVNINNNLDVGDKAVFGDSIFMDGLPIKACDTTLGWSGDTVYKMASSAYWTRDVVDGHIYPTSVTDKLGLGTTNPQYLLHVADDAMFKDSVFMSGLPIKACDTVLGWDADTVYKMASTSGDTSIWVSDGVDEIYTKTATTKVGIGTTSPDVELDIEVSGDNSNINHRVYSTSGAEYAKINMYKYNGVSPASYAAMATQSPLGQIIWEGSMSNSAVYDAAIIDVTTSENWDINNKGVKMDISIVPTDSTSRHIAIRIIDDEVLFPFFQVAIGNENDPDSLFHVAGGAVVETDILVGGGWANWTPSFAFVGGSPTTPSYVAKYSVVNNTVEFNIIFNGNNDSGSTLTGCTISLPFTPRDINSYIPCISIGDNSTNLLTGSVIIALIDQTDNTPANRVLDCVLGKEAPLNTEDYIFTVSGTYEITGK